jgi:hypothetical protein
MPLYLSYTFARCVQSLHSFYSAVELVRLFLNHYHHKPSSTAQQLQRPQRLPDLLPHYTLRYYRAEGASFCKLFA